MALPPEDAVRYIYIFISIKAEDRLLSKLTNCFAFPIFIFFLIFLNFNTNICCFLSTLLKYLPTMLIQIPHHLVIILTIINLLSIYKR